MEESRRFQMDINRRQFVAMALLVGATATALPLASCKKSQLEEAQSQYDTDYALAIIKTTQSKRSSYIEYYDESLNLVRSIWYPYAYLHLGSLGNTTSLYDNELYLIPQGLMGQQDDRKLISFDLQSGKVREYRVDQVALDGVAVDDEYCYVTSDLNMEGHISRVDKVSGEVVYLDMSGVLAGEIVALKDRFYVFCLDIAASPDVVYLSTYNRNLELLDTINLTSLADITISSVPTTVYDGRFYFVSSIQPIKDGQPFLTSIYSFSIQDSKLELFCKPQYEISTVLLEGDKLFVFCSPTIATDDFYIEIYDSVSGELLKSMHVDYAPTHGLFRDGALFVRGSYGIVKYRLDGLDLIEEARTPLGSYGSADDPSFHYISGMFVKP
jgi:hypothetical protein